MANEIIERYLHEVCSYIKNKDMHKEITDEIREHIYEIVDEYTKDGLSEDESINKAIKRLGSASECGIKLNRVHRAKPDLISSVLALVLALIGIITMYSIEKSNILIETSYLSNIIGLIIGGGIATGIYLFDYRKLKKYSYHIYLLALIILIASIKLDKYCLINNATLYKGRIYIHLISAILLLISLSGVLNVKVIRNIKGIMMILIMNVIPLIIYLIANDIIVTMIYFCGVNVVLLSAPINKSVKIGSLCIGAVLIALGVFFLISTPFRLYRVARIISIINPSEESTIMKVRDLLYNSTLFGNKFYDASFKLPVGNEFSLIYIIYNFGILFGGVCISTIMVFILRVFNIIRKVKDNYGKTIVLLAGFIFFAQIIINMLSNFGIMGVYIGLPFICSGCMNSIISVSMVGLICSVYRRRGIGDTCQESW